MDTQQQSEFERLALYAITLGPGQTEFANDPDASLTLMDYETRVYIHMTAHWVEEEGTKYTRGMSHAVGGATLGVRGPHPIFGNVERIPVVYVEQTGANIWQARQVGYYRKESGDAQIADLLVAARDLLARKLAERGAYITPTGLTGVPPADAGTPSVGSIVEAVDALSDPHLSYAEQDELIDRLTR